MNVRTMIRIAVVALLPVHVAGCSLLFVNGPPREHAQMPYFTCTQSNVVPILDAVWAGLNGLGAAIALTTDQREFEFDYDQSRNQTIVVGAGWLLLSGFSAYSGFERTAACRDATMKLFVRQSQSSLGPGLHPPHAAVTFSLARRGTQPDPSSSTSLLERQPVRFVELRPPLWTENPVRNRDR
jgi:hypothetical protein